MPKTAPSLVKSVKVVVSVSPAEYERWERVATGREMRVPEMVRFLVGEAIRGRNSTNNAILDVSPDVGLMPVSRAYAMPFYTTDPPRSQTS